MTEEAKKRKKLFVKITLDPDNSVRMEGSWKRIAKDPLRAGILCHHIKSAMEKVYATATKYGK